jgi:hypothetical protein
VRGNGYFLLMPLARASPGNPPTVATVRWLVLGTTAVSLFHFTDNAINVDTYPKAGWQPDWFPVLVVIAWFLYTAVGVAGWHLYERGRFRAANACLLIYGYLIVSSVGHFLYGSPDEFTTRGLISVFIDIAAGLLAMAVALWSMLARRAGGALAPRAASRP